MTAVPRWGQKPEQVPDTACVCTEIDRKAGVAEVRTLFTDALYESLTVDDWRRLAAKVVVRLRGL